MTQDSTGLRVKIAWKLEKFDGEAGEAPPVEVLTGEDIFSLTELKEMNNGTDQRSS